MRTDNLHVVRMTPLITPGELKRELPLSDTAQETVIDGRHAVRRILAKEDSRMLAVVGPCSIHDTDAALDYAQRLNALRKELSEHLFIIMRAYFEKPRTTVGWKGLINDPHLDDSYDMVTGLRRSRHILLKINEMGLAAGTEMLDTIIPQYISDLITWTSLGARTTESQPHREMASGLSMPVGFKNSTDGNLKVAINAMTSAKRGHHFLGIDGDGKTCTVQTTGNPWCHIILRGGGGRPNYDPVTVAETIEQLIKTELDPLIVVDCSHANCGKRYELQAHVLRDVIQQRLGHNSALVGFMLESNLRPGRQDIPKKETGRHLDYGVSITDPCFGWEETEALLREAHGRLDRG